MVHRQFCRVCGSSCISDVKDLDFHGFNPINSYLDLLAMALTDTCHEYTTHIQPDGTMLLVTLDERNRGMDSPLLAETMVGPWRLRNIRQCANSVMAEGIDGDFIECGVWRGGASIYATAAFAAYGDHRDIWVADSFAGIPAPEHEADKDSVLHNSPYYVVDEAYVRAAFKRYDLLKPNVYFLPGWFKDTMPKMRGKKWSIIRCDCDLYASTMTVLENLYDGLSRGGFCIIDDYFWLKECRQAVDEYRAAHGVAEPIVKIDDQGGYWRKA